MARGILILLLVCGSVWAIRASPTGKKERRPRDLSEEEHFPGEHNTEYDHEAFLGKEEAERFDQLPPHESKRRLRIICDKIDVNKDSEITEGELEEWIRHVGKKYIFDDIDRVWKYYDKDEDGFISWSDYRQSAYGTVENLDEIFDSHRNMSFGQRIAKDERRFKLADTDGDGKLEREEFADFLHPEESPRLFDVYVQETMEDMDGNNDGQITVGEYIDDIWPSYERERTDEEPDWVRVEREGFSTHRDKDGDGFLNKAEIKEWLQPEGYDHARSEAMHLIHNADANKDKVLSKEEVVESFELFVGSQATEWGGYMMRHDEF